MHRITGTVTPSRSAHQLKRLQIERTKTKMATDNNPGFNSFSNDGSFMDMFKKQQEEKEKSSPPIEETIPPVKKVKPVVMKISSLKKKKNPFLAQPIGTKSKAFAQEEDAGDDTGANVKAGAENPVGTGHLSDTTEGTDELPKDGNKSNQVIPPESEAKQTSLSSSSSSQTTGRKRRRNRWSDAPPALDPNQTEDERAIAAAMASFSAVATPMSQNTTQQSLTPAQLQQMKEQIEMNNLVARIRAVTEASNMAGKLKKDPSQPQYEYDSDEDTEGGTWEHKKRSKEMMATFEKAIQLTEMGKGKHHIGHFLPPEELDKFLEKVQAIKEGRDPDFSDYKEHKLDDSNIGFRMLRNSGWSEGEGLGEKGEGIVNPINKGKTSFDQAGIGADTATEVAKDDSAYDTYRKRMMLAYKFRPNPLNNPRRPYY